MEIDLALANFEGEEHITSNLLTEFDSEEHNSQSEDSDPNNDPVEKQLFKKSGVAKSFRRSEETRDSMDIESIVSSQSGRAVQRPHLAINAICPESQRKNIETSLIDEIHEIHKNHTMDLRRPAYQNPEFRKVIEKYVIPQICPRDRTLKTRRNDQYEKKFLMALNKKQKSNMKVIRNRSLQNSQSSRRPRVSAESDSEPENEKKKKHNNIYGFTNDCFRAFFTDPETFEAMTEKGLDSILFHLNEDTEICVKVNLVEKLLGNLRLEGSELVWNWDMMEELCKDKQEKKLPFFHVQNVLCIEVAINKLLNKLLCLNSSQEISNLFGKSKDSSDAMNIEPPSDARITEMIQALNKSKAWLKELKEQRYWADIDNSGNQPKLNIIY